MHKRTLGFGIALALLTSAGVGFQARAQEQTDPVVQKIIRLGTTDNQVMTWNDITSNRFGGRETGTNAYTDATTWLVWQLKQWGLEAELDEVGELPVGFNRGPWFGKVLKPTEKPLRFGTPSFTAGTKGVQRGKVVILKANPFTPPPGAGGAAPGAPANNEWRVAAVQEGIAEVAARKDAFKGAWVLISGSSGTARDGRRPPANPSQDVIPLLTKALVDAGALGTIQSSTPTAPLQPELNSEPPLSILDGYVASWDKLPVLPDIKLLDSQYRDIKALVEKNEPVELEFDIRNWFKMGPVKYHNVVATIRGTTYPDEYVVIGAHFDSFSGGTGAVDDGSGWGPTAEAMRLLAAAGAKPKRSIVFISFGAEESGLLGSKSWLQKRQEIQSKVVMMINRDGSPSAVTGVSVPPTWYAAFQQIAAPLATLNPKWPFKLTKTMPRPKPTGGSTDSASFEMVGVPALNLSSTTTRPGPDGKDVTFNYNYAWHTLNDLYSELVPYTEHQQHTALATALVAYGAANLDKRLTRAGTFLDDGLYATITIGSGDSFMTSLDFVNAPLQVANFVRIVEGRTPPAAGGRGGGPGAFGPGGPGGPPPPPIGTVTVAKGQIQAVVTSDIQKSVAVPALPKTLNSALKHDGAGVVGMSAPNAFYVTLKADPAIDKKSTAIGKVMANPDALTGIANGDPIRSIRITRVGKAAVDFKTDDEAFKKLVEAAAKKK